MTTPTTEVRVTDPHTGGQKGSKPERFDLIPWDGMEEVARVYAFGAEKYEDHNWLKGYAWSLSIAALFRHVVKFSLGETRDRESGLHHLAHAAFHCLALIVFTYRDLGTDDRALHADEPIDYWPTDSEPDPFPKVGKPLDFNDFAGPHLDECDIAEIADAIGKCGAV